MIEPLDAKIEVVAGLTRCRFCGGGIPADAILCACRIAAGELPHTQWGRDLKRMLSVRAIERKQVKGMSEHALWETLLCDAYRGQWIGTGASARLIPFFVTSKDVFALAREDAAAWAAAGYHTTFTI